MREGALRIFFAVSSPGKRVSSGGGLLGHAPREVFGVAKELTAFVAGDALGAVPVVTATATEDLAAVFFEVWGQGLFRSACHLVT